MNQNVPCTLQQPNVVSPVNDHISVTQVSCKRFANFDKVSCYANSLLQCLLQCRDIRQSLQSCAFEPIKRIANDYLVVPTLLSTPVRHAIGPPFSLPQQQDVTEFFLKLADVCTEIESNITFHSRLEFRCSSCGYNYTRRQEDRLLTLFVSGDEIDSALSVDFNDLLASQREWNSPPGFICSSCREGSIEKREMLASVLL